ncbi:MAG TPA: class I SAM-dependent methyltransferase family protein [Acidimicrobiales bacterium]|nr:class I SAM-dependent methyltransferase family protein [Acidimicrobiales bacterium]
MAPGDLDGSVPPSAHDLAEPSHWVRWHSGYEDPASNLSRRLRTVQAMVRQALDAVPSDHAGPIRIVSLCAGQGRDVIDVVAEHPRRADVAALLVEMDPALVGFARARADAAGVGNRVRIVEGDAALARWYAEQVPADLVLVCGVFGNISAADITATVHALSSFCRPGSHVVWTRHRRPPDATPAIRADFAAAGFSEVAFEAPEETVMTVGLHRFDGVTAPFDPARHLFDFVGDGFMPA